MSLAQLQPHLVFLFIDLIWFDLFWFSLILVRVWHSSAFILFVFISYRLAPAQIRAKRVLKNFTAHLNLVLFLRRIEQSNFSQSGRTWLTHLSQQWFFDPKKDTRLALVWGTYREYRHFQSTWESFLFPVEGRG